LAAEAAVVIDLELSRHYAKGHIPGACFAIRAQLGASLAKIPGDRTVVLTSSDGALATLAAAELQAIAGGGPVVALAGGTQAWIKAGLPLETGATKMLDAPDDIFLMPRERHDREAAMREYLTWEINLVNDMAEDDDQRFRVVTG